MQGFMWIDGRLGGHIHPPCAGIHLDEQLRHRAGYSADGFPSCALVGGHHLSYRRHLGGDRQGLV